MTRAVNSLAVGDLCPLTVGGGRGSFCAGPRCPVPVKIKGVVHTLSLPPEAIRGRRRGLGPRHRGPCKPPVLLGPARVREAV